MKKNLMAVLLVTVIGSVMMPVHSQDRKKSFEEFRKGIFNDYHDFRQTILDRYADFLNGEWHEYESLNAVRRDRTPKPSKVPTVEPSAASSRPVRPGKPTDRPTMSPKEVVTPSSHPSSSPTTGPSSSPSVTPSSSPSAKPSSSSSPGGATNGETSTKTSSKISGKEEFEFFGLPMYLPQIDFNIAYRLASTTDYAVQWKDLDKSGMAKKLVPALKSAVTETGLNDYLTYEFVKAYIDSKFPQADSSSRMSAIHYILANLGYDVRIAMSGGGTPLLLLPFKQMVYGRNYLALGGEKYFIFAPDEFDYSRLGTEGVRTCKLPKDVEKGKSFDLVLGELKIPNNPKPFDLAYGPIHLTGEINSNLMPILYRYPQMPIEDYAVSSPDPKLRRQLTRQVKEQLADYQGDEKVEALLGFMHNAFEYETDENFHGFEKPYFLEETLYYPKNDCEDRAIFYTYFLWNSLGREAQLIAFPGHEAATVRLDNPVPGTAYNYDHEQYFISDPTYKGASTGMVMPMYKNEKPKVDYTFKDR